MLSRFTGNVPSMRRSTIVFRVTLSLVLICVMGLVLSSSTGNPEAVPEATTPTEPAMEDPAPTETAQVDPTPTDAAQDAAQADPTPTETPTPDTVQEMVDRASPGDTVFVPAGIYRESVTIDDSITLVGEPGAEIRGSDDWSGEWRQQGDFWVSTRSVPTLGEEHGECIRGARCHWPEQVYLDGRPLERVAGDPSIGQFALSADRNIILADDPSAYELVEVTTRTSWVVGEADDVTVRGFTMQHSGNAAQSGAISNNGYSNWTISDNTLAYAHGANVSVLYGADVRIIDNRIRHSGQLGVHGYRGRHVVIEGNVIHDNNRNGYDWTWEGGGIKLAQSTSITISNNETYRNDGPGIWCDIDCENVTISDNRAHHNSAPGIIYEISSNAAVIGNRVWENNRTSDEGPAAAGIFIQNSSETLVAGNTVAWNGAGIVVWSEDRGEERWNDVTGNTVRDNDVFLVAGRDWDVYGLGWVEYRFSNDMGAEESNNDGRNNRYYHANPDEASRNTFVYVDEGFGWNELDEFNETRGENNARELTEEEKNRILNTEDIPVEPE